MVDIKKTRIEFVYDQFTQLYEKAIKKDKLISPDNFDKIKKLAPDLEKLEPEIIPINDNFIDITFLDFYDDFVDNIFINSYLDKRTIKDVIFGYFLKYDPTPNKEYISWYVKLYSEVIRNRPQINKINSTGILFTKATIRKETLFFEDFGKIADALETFSFIKKTKVLTTKQRDINQYETYQDFIDTVKPYMVTDNVESFDVHTLTHSEIKSIQNFINNNTDDDQPLAELVCENDDWLVIITHNKEANSVFGANTTWCTAGTRYGGVFDSYNKQGKLFVLINKGHGSKSSIDSNPDVRLQFHFESEQFMNARDRPIDIGLFLSSNPTIKDYFLPNVIESVNAIGDDTSKIIKFLTKLGYINQLIPILKKCEAKNLCLNDVKLDGNIISEIGEITSLNELTLVNVGVTEIPESFANLINLKELTLTSNKGIKEIPNFINKLTNLTSLDVSNCDIKDGFDVSGLVNLKLLFLDENRSLTMIPKTIINNKELRRLTASSCNLTQLGDELLELKNVYMFDFRNNINLTSVPSDLTKLEKLVACNFDKTSISNELSNILSTNAVSKKQKCAYIKYNN